MKNILVCTDLSHRSDRAVRRGFQLAKDRGATLTVLHVVDTDLPDALTAPILEKAHEEVAGLCDMISDHPVEIEVKEGEPLETIAAVIAEREPDLVIVGTHRSRPFWDMFSGTTMERIIRASTRPVLLVHNVPDDPYRTVLCGLDLSPASAAAARAAHDLAPEAKIHTYHAVHIPYRGFIAPGGNPDAVNPFVNEAVTDIDDWWASMTLPTAIPKPKPLVMSVTQAMVEQRAEVNPDLIAVGAHGRSALKPTTLGSFTEQLIRNPDIDILVVRR